MCLSTPKMPPPPVMPKEEQAMKSPDNAAVQGATSRRWTDKMRGRAKTILTSGSGVTTSAPTEKKTLLGA